MQDHSISLFLLFLVCFWFLEFDTLTGRPTIPFPSKISLGPSRSCFERTFAFSLLLVPCMDGASGTVHDPYCIQYPEKLFFDFLGAGGSL